tara:strand:+ start:75894 stop:77219 length:1326 start_codon:yes stop_codon:yes gene_type:complete
MIYLPQWLSSLFHGDGLKTKLVRGALGVGGLKLLSLPLTLATSVILARGLGPEGYGQYVFVMAIVSLLALPLGPGLGQLVTREVAKYQNDEDWALFRGLMRRAHQWILLGSTVMGCGIALIASRYASWAVDDRWSLLLIAVLMLPLLGLNALRSSTLRGLRLVFFAQLPELLVRPALHLMIAGCLLLAGILNPATALASQIAGTALAFGVGAWLLLRLKPLEAKQGEPTYRYGKWVRSLLPFTLLAAVSNLNGQIGILILGWLGADKDVAALQIAISASMLVALTLVIVNLVISPYIARAYRDRDKQHLQRLSRNSVRAALTVAVPIALLLIVLGGPIIDVVYGEAYRSDVMLPLQILVFGQMLNVAFGSVGLLLTMSGFERHTLVGQVVALFVNLLAAIILIPPFGAIGAALSIVLGLVTWNVFLAFGVVRKVGIKPGFL